MINALLLLQLDWGRIIDILLPIILIAAAVIIVYLLWNIPIRYISARKNEPQFKDALELENNYRSTLAQMVGGLLVLLGLYFTFNEWQNTKATFDLNRQNFDLNRQNQEAERFNNALENLAEENFIRKIGAIYTMESLAHQNKKDYQLPVFKTFASYIRQNSPYPLPSPSPVSKQKKNKQSLEKTPRTSPSPQKGQPPEISSDIQEILTFIGNIEKTDAEAQSLRLDLTSSNLRKARIQKDFKYADFRGVYAFFADFKHAELKSAKFEFLAKPTYLNCAQFTGANLQKAFFHNADLQGAHFEDANLESTIFANADLRGAYFKGDKLKKTVFSGAKLFGAYLKDTDLREAEGITQEQIDSANIDNTTKLPDGIIATEEAMKPKSYFPCS